LNLSEAFLLALVRSSASETLAPKVKKAFFFFSNKTNVNAHKQLRIFLLLRQTVANDTRKKG
jgi:hypothetical protein